MDKDEARRELQKIDVEMIKKEWIQEKCNTNTPPTTVPTHPSQGNCKCNCHQKQKRKEKYKDILEYIEMYVKWALMSREPNITISEIKPLYDKVQDWLEEEV